MSGFCTSDPPNNGRILPYTDPGPYCTLLVSAALALVTLIAGSFAAIVVNQAKIKWFHNVRHPSVLGSCSNLPSAIVGVGYSILVRRLTGVSNRP